ncbi:MAG: SpoIID/LytB domain-containing protein [Nitrospirales bacterium]|nr:SpoIID/LytB domain-containing protein [Nitrospirales bacterium]
MHRNREVKSGQNGSIALVLLFFLLASPLFHPLSLSAADATIRVLLLDGKSARIPQKNEKVEKLGNAKGEVILSGLKYTGNIDVWRGESGLYLVNEIPLEDYVKGVVAAEVGSRWDSEALKAQAVVARTYALYQKSSSAVQKVPYHLTSSVMHQVYKGHSIPETIAKAVDSTKGEILTYEGSPIAAYYHSTSGGMTEDPLEMFGKSYPYLKPVETGSELSPYYMWEKRIPLADIEKATGYDGIRDIIIDSYTVSNRVRIFKVITGTGEYSVPAKDLRKNLGWEKLPSTMIMSLVREGDAYIFEGKGYGHGVGMCQWTTLEMAREGKSYREILSRFYPGTAIELYENREND